jgi:hypothetical protein
MKNFAIALLTLLPLSTAAANADTIPVLDSELQTSLCQGDWRQSIQAVSLRIGDSETSPDEREELVALRYRLQNWRATGAIAADVMPVCEATAPSQTGIPISVSVSSPPLNFEAAVQSLEDMNSPYSSFVPSEMPQPTTFSQECWVVDHTGQRFDLALLCNGR